MSYLLKLYYLDLICGTFALSVWVRHEHQQQLFTTVTR